LTSPLAGLRPGARRRGRVLLHRLTHQRLTSPLAGLRPGARRRGRGSVLLIRRPDQVKTESKFVASHSVLHVPQRTGRRPRRTGRRPRRWTTGGTPARRDVNRQPFSGTPPRRDVNRQPFSGTPARRDFQSPASHPGGTMSIASPSADGAASTKVDARRHARAARFSIASLSPRRRDFQSPALQRTEQRPRRWTPGGTPARRDVNRQPFSGTPPRRDVNRQPLTPAARCQSPALQRTEQRPRRWTPGGTPARRDFQSPAPPPCILLVRRRNEAQQGRSYS